MTYDETSRGDQGGETMPGAETAWQEPSQHAAQGSTHSAPPAAYASPYAAHQVPATLADDPLHRSPLVAGLLSLAPGLGQVYCGYTRLGFLHAVVVVLMFGFLALDLSDPLSAIGSVFLTFFWLYGIVDAWRRAVLVNQSLLGRLHLDLPEAVGEPGFRGSLSGGVALVALGALLLSNTLFRVPLDWVEDWWPMALIAVGAWLTYRAVRDRKGQEA